ncbi:MAG: PAS domain S-box protein, partial [Rhodothermales bacterium]|nr:PAS domain S-box protein [Rhodothermales bacterium]
MKRIQHRRDRRASGAQYNARPAEQAGAPLPAPEALPLEALRAAGLFEETLEDAPGDVQRLLRRLRLKEHAFATSITPMVFADLEGRLTSVNEAALRQWGYQRPGEVVGRAAESFMKPTDVHHMLSGLHTAGSWQGEITGHRRDGTAFAAELTAFVVPDADGRPLAFMASLVDVSRRKRTEEALRRRDAILSAVNAFAEALLSSPTMEDGMRQGLNALGRATASSRIYVFENSTAPDGTLLASQRFEWTADGIPPQIGNPDLQGMPYDLAGFGRWRQVLGAGLAVAGPVSSLPPDERALLEAQEIRSLAVVPITVEGVFWGFLGLDDCAQSRIWSEPEVEALRAGAQIIVAAVRQNRALQARRESEERWRLLVEHNPEAIFLSIADRILYANPQGLRLLGAEHLDAIVGRTAQCFTGAAAQRDLGERLTALRFGETTEPVTTELHRLDGTTCTVEISSTPVYFQGRPAVQTVVRDVTARVAYEQGLIAARREAEDAARLKSTILTNLSHEIRTPLAGILGFADLLAASVEGEQEASFVQFIQSAGRRLMTTLTTALDLSLLEAGAFTTIPAPTDLKAHTARLLVPFEAAAAERSLRLTAVLQKAPLVRHID